MKNSRATAILLAFLFGFALVAPTSLRQVRGGVSRAEQFPAVLTQFKSYEGNPVFTGAGPGHWDVKIRERGWILKEGETYYLWYTGYDGDRESIKRLGLATSKDGLHWTRYAENPLLKDVWVEDVMVLKRGDTYYMFAEGVHDEAHLLTSKDRIHWTPQGKLDVRKQDNTPIEEGPLGTPAVWFEDQTWYLFYERKDLGIWVATSKDTKVWRNVTDEPVMKLGPQEYDSVMIAFNQIVKYGGKYYASYHGSGSTSRPSLWTSDLAVSSDLIHWKKYVNNPLTGEAENKSSGIFVPEGKAFRFYTMHENVNVHLPVDEKK
ncbi:MAG: glycosylase [Planctomycetales bacterium]